jgi:LytS/YehU family sensor histidine kinase
MLLHPLVENAIKHGMHGAVNGPLTVRVAVHRIGDELVFEVANSGTLAAPVDAVLPVPSGIGLANVKGRLAALFPDRHAFTLVEREGQVVATLRLPLTGAPG